MPRNKKIALVLGGGSAFGYAHIGVIKAMEEKGIRPDLIVGTSMGSIVGSYYAVFGEIDSLVEKISKTSAVKIAADPGFLSLGVIKAKKIEELFKEVFGDRNFAHCKIPLIVNACDINSGENVIYKKGRIKDAVRASMSVPGIFAPVVKGSKVLVDGGVVNNLGINLAPKSHKVIAVKVTPDSNKKIFSPKDMGTLNPIKRMRYYSDLINKSFTILINKLEDQMVRDHEDIIYLKPDLKDFNYASFGKYRELIKAGYDEASKKL
ncbi:patatin-like phospholipase family protein [Candidatus Peregrinibacteria bacterium]|nr:patatin-like phospholipase family protein [Candidatus Peregrinibacteria bacterium]